MKAMKKEVRNILRKTSLLHFLHSLIHMLFLLYTAERTSEILSDIQASQLKGAISGIVALIFLWGLSGILAGFLNKQILSVQTQEKFRAREAFLYRILHASRTEKNSAGAILENISNDINRMIEHYGSRRPEAVTAAIGSLLYLCVAVYISPPVSLCMILLALLEMLPPVAVRRFFMKNYLDCREIEAAITDVLIEGYKGAEEIKVYRALPWLNSRLYSKHKEYEKIGMKSEIAFTEETMLSSLIKQIISYGFYVILGLFFGNKIITIADVAVLGILSGDYFTKMNLLFQMIPDFTSDRAAFGRIEKWDITYREEQEDIPEIRGEGRIHVEDFNLSYGEKQLFQSFRADISLKKRTVLLGENGSGKTSFLRFLAGVSEEGTGKIQILAEDGTEGGFPAKTAYLPQECPGLVYSAMELVRPEDREGLFALSKEMKIEEKYLHTPFDRLSGGQRKKIYLSVIFCSQASFLLLDEPTNDLDEDGKKVLKAWMINHPAGILYITHDPEFINLAEESICLNKTGEKRK